MFGIGAPELLVILVIALVIFGPGKLPEIGSALGRSVRDFKKSFDGIDDNLTRIEAAPQPLPRAEGPAPVGADEPRS